MKKMLVRMLCISVAGLSFVSAGRAWLMNPAEQQQASQLSQKRDWPALAALADRAVRRDAKDGWAWYYAGLANDGLGRRDAAVAAYEKSMPFVPSYMQGSIAQVLAQDYAALNETQKIAALAQQFEKTNPEIARSLRLQFPAIAPRPAPAALPEISPRTLDAVTSKVRRTWRVDAIPVQINLEAQDNRTFRLVYNFYSPSSRTGLSVIQGGPALPVGEPRGWSTVAIPAHFLPLAEALARSSAPQHALVEHALLFVSSGMEPAVGLSWTIAIADGLDAVEIPAYQMTHPEFEALSAAAERGSAASEYTLAMVYLNGAAGVTDPGRAAEWLAKSAARGDPRAQNKLGQFYEYGVGVRQNVGVAAEWYQKSANSGFPPGEFNLGLMYEQGRGVPRNYVTARQWIERAARRGWPAAVDELPVVTAAANGEIRRAQQLRAQRSGGGGGKCPPGYMPTGSRCISFAIMMDNIPH